MIKIYIDSDIILDLLLDRLPFADAAEQLFKYIKEKKVNALSTAVSFSNIYYILNDINKRKDAKAIIEKINKNIKIMPVDNDIMRNSYKSVINDFEDALQYETCIKHKIDYIVTRNKNDYKNGKIEVFNSNEINILIKNMEISKYKKK